MKLCHDLKRDPQFAGATRPKIVIVGAEPRATERVRGTLAGCDAYLGKPLVESEFMDTLRRLEPTLTRGVPLS